MNNKEDQQHEIYILSSLCGMGMSLNDAIVVYALSNRLEDSFSEAYIEMKKIMKDKDAQKNNEKGCESA